MAEHKLNPFARGTTIGLPPTVLDVAGRELHEGDSVQVYPPNRMPPLYRVQKIAPLLDPKAPPNMMEITVVSVLRFAAPRNQSNLEFLRILQAKEDEPDQGDPDMEQKAEVVPIHPEIEGEPV